MFTALLIPVHSCDITTDLDSDMSSESPPPGVQKDERFWFDDGTIVLIARNAVAFRVYKGLLARTSPVFHDIFAIGDADAPDTEKMDGCAVIHVTDAPEDLRAFLKLIFDMTPR